MPDTTRASADEVIAILDGFGPRKVFMVESAEKVALQWASAERIEAINRILSLLAALPKQERRAVLKLASKEVWPEWQDHVADVARRHGAL